MTTLVFQIDSTGAMVGLWSDAFPLREIAEGGQMEVTRASNIEWSGGQWHVEIAGQVLFSDESREACLQWERDYFNAKLAN